MISEELANFIRREVYRVLALRSKPRVGLVSAYDPDTHSVKVRLQPEGNETGWVPLETLHIGNGYGITMGPELGDQLEVEFQGGDPKVPRIVGRIFSDKEKPPRVEAGEMLLRRKDGSFVLMDKDGNTKVNAKTQVVVTTEGGNIYLRPSGKVIVQ